MYEMVRGVVRGKAGGFAEGKSLFGLGGIDGGLVDGSEGKD